MKVTKEQLKEIIKEEIDEALRESRWTQPSPTLEKCKSLLGIFGRYKPENPEEVIDVRACEEIYPEFDEEARKQYVDQHYQDREAARITTAPLGAMRSTDPGIKRYLEEKKKKKK